MNISSLDLLIVIAYFAVIFWIAIRISGGIKNSQDYFLAGRKMRWPMIGASLFATNISAEQFVGQAGLAVVIGIAVANYQMAGVLGFALMGLLFLPIYIRLGIVTTPQFLGIRYGVGSWRFMSIFQILYLCLNIVPVSFYAGGQVMKDLFGWETIVPGVLILAIATGIYAVVGGLKAVVVTDYIQMFILVFGGLLVLLFGLQAVGGIDALMLKVQSYEAREGVDLMSMVRGSDDTHVPWTGVVFGLTVHALYYFSMNHSVVQRALAAESIHQGRMGGLFAALLKTLTLFIIVIPGVIGLMLIQDGYFASPPDSPDQLYSIMVRSLLPTGLIGLTLAGLVAALMSSVDSSICSASSLITLDWYQKARPEATERELVLAGRITGVVIIVSSILWAIFVIPSFKFLFDYFAKFTSYSVGGVLACFLCGMVSPIPNRKAGFWTLVFGSLMGVIMWLSADNAEVGYWVDKMGLDFLKMHFLHAAAFLTVFSICLLFAISLLTKESGQALFQESRKTRLPGKEPTAAENKQFYTWIGIVGAIYVGIYWLFW